MASRQHKLDQQLRQWLAEQHRVGDLPDEVVHATASLLQRGRYRLLPLDEAVAAIALASLASLARLAKQNDWPNRSLGDVVRRLNILAFSERPHRRLRAQNAAAHARRFVASATRALIEQSDHPDTYLPRPSHQRDAIDFVISIDVPQSEHAVQQTEQALADPTVHLFTFGNAAKVADQVSETDLALLHFDVRVARVAIADDNAAGLVADKFASYGACARVSNDEDRCVLADCGPNPFELARLPPSGLI